MQKRDADQLDDSVPGARKLLKGPSGEKSKIAQLLLASSMSQKTISKPTDCDTKGVSPRTSPPPDAKDHATNDTAVTASATASSSAAAKDAAKADSTVKCFMPFPEKLMSILESREYDEAIRWNSKGDAICIISKEFTDKVLKKHFQNTKFESFTRKLNRWGFKRIIDQSFPPSALVYRHEMFQRDKPELLPGMKGGKKREPSLREQLWQEQLSLELQQQQAAGRLPANVASSSLFAGNNLALPPGLQQVSPTIPMFSSPVASMSSAPTQFANGLSLFGGLSGGASNNNLPAPALLGSSNLGDLSSQLQQLQQQLQQQQLQQQQQQRQRQQQELQLRLMLVNQQEQLSALARPNGGAVSAFLSSSLHGGGNKAAPVGLPPLGISSNQATAAPSSTADLLAVLRSQGL